MPSVSVIEFSQWSKEIIALLMSPLSKCSIASERAKDDKVIYLFLDNAGYHSGQEVKKAYKELNIEPIFNVGY